VFISSLVSKDILYFPGVLQADPGTVRDHSQIFRLFCHEAQRVFHDRLINDEDKRYFNTILAEMSQKHFSQVCVKNNR
jgi:dynein heavy chain